MNWRRAPLWFATLLALVSAHGAEPARRLLPKLTADGRTLFLLEAAAGKGALVDRTGRTSPAVAGGAVAADPQFGALYTETFGMPDADTTAFYRSVAVAK